MWFDLSVDTYSGDKLVANNSLIIHEKNQSYNRLSVSQLQITPKPNTNIILQSLSKNSLKKLIKRKFDTLLVCLSESNIRVDTQETFFREPTQTRHIFSTNSIHQMTLRLTHKTKQRNQHPGALPFLVSLPSFLSQGLLLSS